MYRSPMLRFDTIPESEHQAIKYFDSAIQKMDILIEEFGACFELLSHCEKLQIIAYTSLISEDNIKENITSQSTLNKWENIARKNGALIIYDVFQIKKGVLYYLENLLFLSLELTKKLWIKLIVL